MSANSPVQNGTYDSIDPETTEILGPGVFESTEWKDEMTVLPKDFNVDFTEEHMRRIEVSSLPGAGSAQLSLSKQWLLYCFPLSPVRYDMSSETTPSSEGPMLRSIEQYVVCHS